MKNDPVLEDLKDLTEEHLQEVKRSPWPGRIILIFSALFMLFIVITYFLPGDFLSILEGRLESETLSEGFTVELDNGGKVVFEREIYEELKQLYSDNQKTEIKVCLLGYKQGADYYITDLEIPKTISKNVFSVSARSCSKETVIPLHTHPLKHCLFSEQDIISYEAFRRINPDAIIGLMCEPDRFSFYGV